MSVAQSVRARRAGKLGAEDVARELGVPARLVRWRIRQFDIATDADRMVERAEVERIRRDFACRAAGCPRIALGRTRYCGDHEGLGRRGQKRTPEQRARIAVGMSGRPRADVADVMRERWSDPEIRTEILRAQTEGRQRARREFERLKAGRLDVDQVAAHLKRRGIRRATTTIAEHIREGWLEAERLDVPGLPGRAPYVCTPEAVDAYVARLQAHRDGRLRRFDDPRFRASWYAGAHGSQAEWGRVAADLTDHVGRARDLSEEQAAEIRRLASIDRGGRPLSIRAIARIVDVPKGRVERLLRADELSRNPPAQCPATPPARRDCQPSLPGMEAA